MSQHTAIECPGQDGGEWVLCRKDKQGKRRTIGHIYDEQVKDEIVRAVNSQPDLIIALKNLLSFQTSEKGMSYLEYRSHRAELEKAAEEVIRRAEEGG